MSMGRLIWKMVIARFIAEGIFLLARYGLRKSRRMLEEAMEEQQKFREQQGEA